MRFLKYILLIMLLSSTDIFAQNIDRLFTKKPRGERYLNMTGSFAANSVYNSALWTGSPFSYFLNGNINLMLLGFDIPLSFAYTNKEFSYSQPFKFNRLSLNPSYQWIRTYIGDASMSFSPYTLSGHRFTGFGAELTPPGPWKGAFMYGKLMNAVEYEPEAENSIPSYRRYGYGFKTSYEKEKYKIGVTAFTASDDAQSVNDPGPAELNITPKENLVVAFNGMVKPMKGLQLLCEYSVSALTRDILAAKDTAETRHMLGNLISQYSTTSYFKAIKTGMSYSAGNSTMGVNYERIDPGYETLGAYYFNNDLENITANVGYNFLRGKMNLQMNGGFQRDDLNNKSNSKMGRFIGSVNLNYRPGEKLNTLVSYSNFQTYIHIKNQFDYINAQTQYENLDTLNFTQLSQNASLNMMYLLKSNEKKNSSLNLFFSFMESADKQGDIVIKGNGSQFYNLNSGYSRTNSATGLTLTGSVNSSYNTIGRENSYTYGPVLAVRKMFLDKKVGVNISSAYNRSYASNNFIASVLNVRLGSNARIMKKHVFNLNINMQKAERTQNEDTSNFTVMVGYNYSFGPLYRTYKL